MANITQLPDFLKESQRSDEWRKNRLGKFTGSGIHKLMSKGRSKDQEWGESAKSYVFEKLYERVSQSVITIPETYQMMKGTEIEDEAIRVFGERTRFYIAKAEFMTSEECDFIGASPDGLVYDVRDKLCGIFETKCRLDSTMLKNAFTPVTEKHDAFWQLQTEMFVVDVKEAYFTHYSDERNPPFDLQIQIVKRDDTAIQRMIERAKIANQVINDAIESVGGINDKRISFITLTERLINMRNYIWENLK